jgi:hypothetical protein
MVNHRTGRAQDHSLDAGARAIDPSFMHMAVGVGEEIYLYFDACPGRRGVRRAIVDKYIGAFISSR